MNKDPCALVQKHKNGVVSGENSGKIILALDTPAGREALALLETLGPAAVHVKIGPALFLREGPPFVQKLKQSGYRVFLDLKLHDIPTTVALGVRAAKDLGVWMLSVHLAGGTRMLSEAAREAGEKVLLAGVTVLTSLDDAEIAETGVGGPVEEQVKRLASLAAASGIRAVVASGREIKMLKKLLGNRALLVAPGIRPQNFPAGDQSRTMTPLEALEAGADYLVIGRPVLQARNPKEALDSIVASMNREARL